VFSAVRGPRRARRGGLPRALDGTERQNAVCSRPGNLRTAVIVKDGVPYNVRQIGVGERAGRRGTAGGCCELPGTVGNGGAVGDGRDSKHETFPTGDCGAPSPWRWVVGQVWKKTERDDTTSSTAALL